MSVEPGYQQVVFSQSDKIGLPNWSFFAITASIKVVVPIAEAEAAWSYCAVVGNAYILERAEAVAREVGTYYGPEGSLQQLDEAAKMALAPQGITATQFELTYTQKETVGLPEKSSFELFASSGMSTAPGQEFQGLRYLASSVARKLFEQRAVVKENSRPWIVQH